jgi:hypothetical protein
MLMLVTPFPAAWIVIFWAVFFLFFNTGPSNTILANVTRPSIRATAFAFNIFLIHTFGDAISPPLLGKIVGRQDQPHWDRAFLVVTVIMILAALFWGRGIYEKIRWRMRARARSGRDPAGQVRSVLKSRAGSFSVSS